MNSAARFSAMIALQEEMNRKVNRDWRTAGYAWYRAIWTECAEMLDHVGWKWWKDLSAAADLEQVRLELVDIWHFGMSDLMTRELAPERIAARLSTDLQTLPTRPADDVRGLIESLAHTTLAERAFQPQAFFQLMGAVDMNLDSLHRRYVGKNVLNFFRQDHGYKAGTYQKTWAGREDNAHLSEILTRLDADAATFREDVYQALLGRYPV